MDKSQMLRFSTCQYVNDGYHIILKGASGNGKTYIACALGNAACRRFKSFLYIHMPEHLDELNIVKSSGELQKLLKAYKKVAPGIKLFLSYPLFQKIPKFLYMPPLHFVF